MDGNGNRFSFYYFTLFFVKKEWGALLSQDAPMSKIQVPRHQCQDTRAEDPTTLPLRRQTPSPNRFRPPSSCGAPADPRSDTDPARCRRTCRTASRKGLCSDPLEVWDFRGLARILQLS